MNAIIIGNGVAGMKIAEEFRSIDAEASIDVFSDEPYGYYSRIWLPEVVAGTKSVDAIIMRNEAWYDQKSIVFHPSTKVSSISPADKTITLENGEIKAYNKLFVCTGASNSIPPITNASIPGVFTIRTIDDALAVKDWIQGKETAVCIGGGLLGLEAARNLETAGLRVTVVEVFPRLLPKQLCQTSSSILQEKIQEIGIKTIVNTTVEEILGSDTVTGVKLASGEELPADVVLVSAGIKARVDLAREAGLEVNKGVVVNEFMQTNDPDIYAAGDVIEFQGRGWGIIPAALEQATLAAKHAAGVEVEPYQPTTPSNKLKIIDFDVMSVGSMILDDEDDQCRVFISKNELAGVYKKFVVKDEKLIGAILLDAKEDEAFVSQNINKPISEADLVEHMKIEKREAPQAEE